MEHEYGEASEDWRVFNIRVHDWEAISKGKLFIEFCKNSGSNVFIKFIFSIHISEDRFYSPLHHYFIEEYYDRFSGVSGFDRYLVTEGVLNEI